jgi:hypothetical protein
VARQKVCKTNKEKRMIENMTSTQHPVNSSLTNAAGRISVPNREADGRSRLTAGKHDAQPALVFL